MRIDFASIQVTKFQDFIDSIESREGKMFFLENAIEWYKSKREIKTELISANERITQEISILKDKLSGLDELVNITNRIDFEIAKFGNLGKETQLENQVTNLKTGRIANVISALKSFRNFLLNAKPQEESNNKEISIFEGKLVLYISLFIGLSSMGLFIVNRNLLSLFSGIFFIIFNLILFSLINKARYDENQAIRGLNLSFKPNGQASYDQLIQKLNNHQEEFFVNAAWVNALKIEKENINEVIQDRLSGYELDKVQSLIKEKEDMIAANEKMIGDMAFSTITSEEYLDIRREMDIMKIEQTDIQNESAKVDVVQIDNLKNIQDSTLSTRLKDFFDFLSKSIKVAITS